jgi:hypothetical protein
MIYEIRTYTLRPGSVAEFEERYARRLPAREKHSKLGAFWHTEFGPLNQVVHVYPYDDLNHRARVRAAMAQDPERNALPGGQDLVVAQEAEIVNQPAFMHLLNDRDYGSGNVYEMRIYTYAAGDLAKQMPAREKGLAAREALSPVVAYWPSEIGALNRFIHVYVYKDLAERASVRKRMAEARQPAAPGAIRPIRQENKLLIPAAFSPLK